jgi:hypothetical protein
MRNTPSVIVWWSIIIVLGSTAYLPGSREAVSPWCSSGRARSPSSATSGLISPTDGGLNGKRA